MTDQQRCPECRGKAWNGWCGVCNPLPGQEPLVVPDSVIEQATATAIDPLAEQRIIPAREDLQLAVELAAPVIARWAREQGRTEGAAEERALVRKVVGRRYEWAEAAYDITGGTYEQGRMDGVGELLTALGREEPA